MQTFERLCFTDGERQSQHSPLRVPRCRPGTRPLALHGTGELRSEALLLPSAAVLTESSDLVWHTRGVQLLAGHSTAHDLHDVMPSLAFGEVAACRALSLCWPCLEPLVDVITIAMAVVVVAGIYHSTTLLFHYTIHVL
jgi:hypothetical protein